MVYHNVCTLTNYVNRKKYFMKRNLLMSVDFDIMGGSQALNENQLMIHSESLSFDAHA